MSSFTYVPNSAKAAGHQVRLALASSLSSLPKEQFIRAWSSIAYLFPGLHPDGFNDADSDWPRALKQFAVEAWRRADAGILNQEELYPSDAQWAGIFDRMLDHTTDEVERRRELASTFAGRTFN